MIFNEEIFFKINFMLYLIGVKHQIQYPLGSGRSDYTDEEINYFLKYMKTLISTISGVSFIAEEMNEDGMKKRIIESTSLRDFVNDPQNSLFNLRHIFMEPSKEECQALGIPTEKERREKLGIQQGIISTADQDKLDLEVNKYFGVRENFWLSKIKSELENDENGLVIIGSKHMKTFPGLLESKNIDYKILCQKWNPDF